MNTKILEIKLENLPPTINLTYRRIRNRVYKSQDVKKYQNKVIQIIQSKYKGSTYKGRVKLHIILTTNNHYRWDIDNRVKIIQDCLELSNVIENDSQIDELHVERRYENEQYTKIILTPIKKKPAPLSVPG